MQISLRLILACILPVFALAGCLLGNHRDLSDELALSGFLGRPLVLLYPARIFSQSEGISLPPYCLAIYSRNPNPNQPTAPGVLPIGTPIVLERFIADLDFEGGHDVLAIGFVIHPRTHVKAHFYYRWTGHYKPHEAPWEP